MKFIRFLSLALGIPLLIAFIISLFPAIPSIIVVPFLEIYVLSLLFIVTADHLQIAELSLGYDIVKRLLVRLSPVIWGVILFYSFHAVIERQIFTVRPLLPGLASYACLIKIPRKSFHILN